MTLPAISEFSDKLSRFKNAHWPAYVFIHINKTAGSSIERALKLRFEHLTAAEKQASLGAFRWQRAFKFSFVRNPWARSLSHYKYRVTTNQTGMGDRHISFNDWIRRCYVDRDPRYYDQPKMFNTQLSWLRDRDGVVCTDFIGRFENLPHDFQLLCQSLNRVALLPHLKQTEPSDYRSYYGSQTTEIVRRTFAEDIEYFKYQF